MPTVAAHRTSAEYRERARAQTYCKLELPQKVVAIHLVHHEHVNVGSPLLALKYLSGRRAAHVLVVILQELTLSLQNMHRRLHYSGGVRKRMLPACDTSDYIL